MGLSFVVFVVVPVGASLLAMLVNDDAGCLIPRGDLWFIASMLSPTRGRVFQS
jgi:hypothetical protein